MLLVHSNSPCLPAPAERWFAWNLSVIDDRRITDEMKRKSQDSLCRQGFSQPPVGRRIRRRIGISGAAGGFPTESRLQRQTSTLNIRLATRNSSLEGRFQPPRKAGLQWRARRFLHGSQALRHPQRRVSPPAKTRRAIEPGAPVSKGEKDFQPPSYFGIYLASARLVSNMPSTRLSKTKRQNR